MIRLICLAEGLRRIRADEITGRKKGLADASVDRAFDLRIDRSTSAACCAAALNFADLQARRRRELIKTKTIPQAELDLRESTLLKARSALEQAKAVGRASLRMVPDPTQRQPGRP
jgi:multidrug resistance efflux pump